jgi:naphthalene 1,2-dioxygenase system ferredoxin subunit
VNHRLCRLSDLGIGEMRGFRVGGRMIAVYRLEDGVYATEDKCPHGLARLSDGYLDDGIVECPLHGGCFDVRSGRAVAPPVDGSIDTFAVAIEDGVLIVAL